MVGPGIPTLSDAISFARSAERSDLPIYVADWSELAEFFDREALWDTTRYDRWIDELPHAATWFSERLQLRYASPALLSFWQEDGLDGAHAVYARAVAGLGTFAVRRSLDVFRQASALLDLEVPGGGEEHVRPIWLHPPSREEPFAITLLADVERSVSDPRRLERSEARYRGIVQDQTDFIVRYRPDGVRTFVNDAYARFFGEEPEELVGKGFLDLVEPSHRPAVFEKIRRLVERDASSLTEEHLSLRHDGEWRWTQWNDRAIFDTEGNLLELQAVGRDVTERRRAEEERLRLERELAEARRVEAVGTLAGGLAHDFSNMLLGMQAHLEDLRARAGEPEAVVENAEALAEFLDQASDLVGSLLQVSSRHPHRPRPFAPRALLESAVRLLRPAIPDRIELAVEAAEDLPSVQADPGHLTRALVNLGLNARDAISSKGRIELRVEVADSGAIAFRVSDDGAGIPPDVRERIFEPFFTTKEEGHGTGLGLAMVSSCAGAHGGTVEVESTPGRGTRVTLCIPSGDSTGDGDPSTGPIRATVLLVDDEPSILLFSRAVLEKAGLRVLTAAGPEEALDRWRDEPAAIDLLITDQRMPDGSGTELASSLRAVRPSLPVLLVSGDGSREVEHAAVTSVLPKPYTPDELLRAVRRTLDAG